MSGVERTDADVARSVGVTPRTLKRWVDTGVVPKDGAWTPAAIARRRIKTGGDVRAALEILPLTKPVFARYTAMIRAEYPHLEA